MGNRMYPPNKLEPLPKPDVELEPNPPLLPPEPKRLLPPPLPPEPDWDNMCGIQVLWERDARVNHGPTKNSSHPLPMKIPHLISPKSLR
eukprot:64373-Amorphochlora_amoeboformis.AAC.2